MQEQKQNEEEEYSPYCPVCSGCGEEGCCSPLVCTNDPKGDHCYRYFRDLKFGYMMYMEMTEFIHADKERYKELINKMDSMFDEMFDIVYGKAENQNEN